MAASHPDYPMWSALLRWSLTQTDGTDEARAPPKAMSAEDREFLAKVMKECTVDHAQRIGACLEAVAAWTAGAPGAPDAAACVAALEEIEYFIEDLDFARDLCKLGGMKVVLDALAKAGGGDVARAAAVVVAAPSPTFASSDLTLPFATHPVRGRGSSRRADTHIWKFPEGSHDEPLYASTRRCVAASSSCARIGRRRSHSAPPRPLLPPPVDPGRPATLSPAPQRARSSSCRPAPRPLATFL